MKHLTQFTVEETYNFLTGQLYTAWGVAAVFGVAIIAIMLWGSRSGSG